MLIKQFQFVDITEDEREIIPDFCEWLCLQMFEHINTKLNRRKIQLKLNYLYSVPWIHWVNSKYIDVQTIMNTIFESFTFEEYKNNVWKITTNTNIVVPNTTTSIDRLIRFLNFGDIKVRGTGIFTQLQNYYTYYELYNLWKIFINAKLGTVITDAKIIV